MMARFFNSMLGIRYIKLPSQKTNPDLNGTKVHMQDSLKTPTVLFLVLVIVVLVGLGGFTFGLSITDDRDSLPEWTHSLLRVHVDWTKQTIRYNKTFGAAPSADESTEEAWDALVPRELCSTYCGKKLPNHLCRGTRFRLISYEFFKHFSGLGCASTPLLGMLAIAIKSAGLYIDFWQYSIRRAYFSAADLQRNDENFHEPRHMRHCFDYLRQSLMCAADSSLEPQHPYLPRVTGWDFSRRCQSYDELKAWAEHWRANDRYGFRDGRFPSKTQVSAGHDF